MKGFTMFWFFILLLCMFWFLPFVSWREGFTPNPDPPTRADPDQFSEQACSWLSVLPMIAEQFKQRKNHDK